VFRLKSVGWIVFVLVLGAMALVGTAGTAGARAVSPGVGGGCEWGLTSYADGALHPTGNGTFMRCVNGTGSSSGTRDD
jgi:hypothetical protein